MKKRTNWEMCEDITKMALMVTRLIDDINLIKKEASKLQLHGKRKGIIINVIKQYDLQMKKIYDKNWINWYNRGEKHLYRNFRKPSLKMFDEDLRKDIETLSKYQNELLDKMDEINNMTRKEREYSKYNLYDVDGNVWISGGNFKNMDDALESIEQGTYTLKTGHKYYIISSDKKATFTYNLSGEVVDCKIISLKNNVQVTCETLTNGEWIHTTYQTTDYKINDLILALRTDKNVRDIGEVEPIPTREWQYTYKTRGFSLGCQPKEGFKRAENIDGFKFEVIIYDRQLTKYEIDTYELKALN